jgi:hypothetical protein
MLRKKTSACHRAFESCSYTLKCFQARNRTGNLGLAYDTLSTWYARQTDLPDDAAFFASLNENTSNGSADYYSAYPNRRQSGLSVGSTSRHLLSRTPTTRSDPSEFKVSQVFLLLPLRAPFHRTASVARLFWKEVTKFTPKCYENSGIYLIKNV